MRQHLHRQLGTALSAAPQRLELLLQLGSLTGDRSLGIECLSRLGEPSHRDPLALAG